MSVTHDARRGHPDPSAIGRLNDALTGTGLHVAAHTSGTPGYTLTARSLDWDQLNWLIESALTITGRRPVDVRRDPHEEWVRRDRERARHDMGQLRGGGDA